MSSIAACCMLAAVSTAHAKPLLEVSPDKPHQPYPARKSYVVLIVKSDYADAGWRKAAEALRKKHDADLVILPDSSLAAALPELKRLRPRYTCLVSSPERAGRKTVVKMHRMMRELDDDPYGDSIWSILTGFESADAVRIAKHSKALVIQTAASSMGPGSFKNLKGGFASAETKPTNFWYKVNNGETVFRSVQPDATEALANAFNTMPPDVFVTSGHATERDWQVAYNMPGGQFRHKDGQLFSLSTQRKRYDISSPHPKIYMPMGNCLIGHIPARDCMATAWMHSGGVYQMFGYTAVTFHGYMGWGIGTYFADGRLTLAQAWYLNNQALLHKIQTQFPAKSKIDFETYDHRAAGQHARKYRLDRNSLGALWDRDVVAFYGDPAWEARHKPSLSWRCKLEAPEKGQYLFEVEALRNGKWANRPLITMLPARFDTVSDIKCASAKNVLVTDDFVLIPAAGPFKKGDRIEVSFAATLAKDPKTSARHKPVDTTAVDKTTVKIIRLYPEELHSSLEAVVLSARENREHIVTALKSVPKSSRAAMGFLVANMPVRDIQELSSSFLLENVALAVESRSKAPWGKRIPEKIFLNDVLPYASLNEARDNWRTDFRKRFLPVVKDYSDPGPAAIALNTNIYAMIGVEYHATKRKKPDQSPYESMKIGFASCTGLSILLVDACRAVGIPARIAGVPQWTKTQGNHTWVEVWDGEWHVIGAAESKALNSAWFTKAAAQADPTKVMTRVYASCWERRDTFFPLCWAPSAKYVSAFDVTASYAARAAGE